MRWRERRLRSWLRHERLTVPMELAATLHHSRGVGPSPRAAIDDATPAPVDEHIAPAPAVHFAPAPAVYAAPAPVNEYVAPAPPVPIVQVVQSPQVQLIDKIVEITDIQSGQGTQTSGDSGNGGVRVTSPCRIGSSDTCDDTRGRSALCDGGARSICSRGRVCRTSSDGLFQRPSRPAKRRLLWSIALFLRLPCPTPRRFLWTNALLQSPPCPTHRLHVSSSMNCQFLPTLLPSVSESDP